MIWCEFYRLSRAITQESIPGSCLRLTSLPKWLDLSLPQSRFPILSSLFLWSCYSIGIARIAKQDATNTMNKSIRRKKMKTSKFYSSFFYWQKPRSGTSSNLGPFTIHLTLYISMSSHNMQPPSTLGLLLRQLFTTWVLIYLYILHCSYRMDMEDEENPDRFWEVQRTIPPILYMMTKTIFSIAI